MNAETWLISLVVTGLAVLLLLLKPSCRHTDDNGQTTLMWSTHEGRLRGYCHECQQWTSGWPLTARSWWLD